MIEKKILDSKPDTLMFKRRGNIFVYLNVTPEITEEKIFKKSAFVGTGKMKPTGRYIVDELKLPYDVKITNFSDLDKYIRQELSTINEINILRRFSWNGYKVWLSKENQQNYASWLSAAKLNNNVLPFKAKFNIGIDNKAIYYEFNSVEELEDFYCQMIKHINDCVNQYRENIDNYELLKDLYRTSFNENRIYLMF